MSHLDPTWRILTSFETAEHNRSVDIFARPDGSFGFEEFRRDPEDMGAWYDVSYYAELVFDSQEAAVAAAREHVHWMESV